MWGSRRPPHLRGLQLTPRVPWRPLPALHQKRTRTEVPVFVDAATLCVGNVKEIPGKPQLTGKLSGLAAAKPANQGVSVRHSEQCPGSGGK